MANRHAGEEENEELEVVGEQLEIVDAEVVHRMNHRANVRGPVENHLNRSTKSANISTTEKKMIIEAKLDEFSTWRQCALPY